MSDLRKAIDPEEWPAQIAFVRRLARSLVTDVEGAEDVAQETWLAWLRAPPKQPATLRSWLARVVGNLARMRFRGDRRRDARERESARPANFVSTADAVAQVDLHHRVVERVLALDEPYRAVIVLRFFEERSLQEVANALEMPVESVKTRQKRALQRLREELLGDYGSEVNRERWHALLMLAEAGGDGAMTIGTKSVVAAGLLSLLAVSYTIWSGQSRVAERSGLESRATDPTVAAEPAPTPEAVAVRTAEPPATKTPPVAAVGPDATNRHRITGDVADGAGRPLAKRRVELFATDPRSGRPAPLDSTESDDEGRFTFAAAPFARRSSGVVMAWDGAACTGASFDPRGERPVHLVLGARKSLVGRVTDETGNPIAGATLIASQRMQGSREGFRVPASASGALTDTSDEQGWFRLPDLPCGWKVYVEASAAGFANRREPFDLDETSADVTATIVLLPECTIEGRVTTADGSPAPAIRVGAQAQDSARNYRNSWGEANTDAVGRYRIRGLESGGWNVFVSLDEKQERDWCATAAEGVRLTSDEPRGQADFELRRGGELIVHVVDAATKAPIADEWVGIKSAAKPASGAAINAVFSDDEGVGRIRLPPGPVFPYLSESSQKWSQQGGELAENETLEVTVEVDRGVTLRGVVVNPDGQPIANATVWTLNPGRSWDTNFTTTKEDGTFEITVVIRSNPWILRAAASGLAMPAPSKLDPATTDSDHIELRLAVTPANTLRGRVVDAGGAPVAGVEIDLASRSDTGNFHGAGSADPATHAKTTVDGRFEFHGLWPKTAYSVQAVRLVESGSAVRVDVASAEGITITESESRELPELTLHPQKSND